MTRFLACQLAMDHYYSMANAAHDFGYLPAIGLDEGLRRTFAA
jgi:hypothetical protein